MKRLFHLIIITLAATALFSGCQKYDDSDLRKQIQELREKLASLEAAPDLPSDELAVNCYAGMFFECLSLESAPYLPAEKLVSGCYDSMFRDCPHLKSIKVAFTDWADGTATPDWVSGVAAEGDFECPESLEVKYGKDYIPTGWSVNGAVPVSATKSVAEPAAKSISGSLCNSPASKTLKIQNRPDGRGMITL